MLLAVLLLALTARAQVLNVKVGNVTYRYPASKTGVMTYTDSDTLNILGKPYVIQDIDHATVTDSVQADNTVDVDIDDSSRLVTIANEQWADDHAFDLRATNQELFQSAISGIKLNFQMSGVTHVEVESVDGYAIAGTATLDDEDSISRITDRQSIITYRAPSGSTLDPETDYVVTVFPCDLYGGYRLSIVKGGSWDSSRDACRTEYSDDAREASTGYANVGFRVVRVDRE